MGKKDTLKNIPLDATLDSQKQRVGEGVNGNIFVSFHCKLFIFLLPGFACY